MKKIELKDLIEQYKNSSRMEKKDTSVEIIRQAYNFISEIYESMPQGDEYLQNSLHAAFHIASWRLSPTHIAVALLYRLVFMGAVKYKDIAQNCNTEVVKMLQNALKLEGKLNSGKEITDFEKSMSGDRELQKRIGGISPHIVIADYLYQLDMIETYESELADNKINYVKNILIPLANYLEAYKMKDELEERVFAIEQKKEYERISQKHDEYYKANFVRCNQTVLMFENLFLKGKVQKEDEIFPPELDIYKSFIADFVCEPRSNISIFRQIVKNSKNIKKDFDNILNKKNVAFYNLTLTFHNITDGANRELKPYDIFFKYYDAYLLGKDICILDYQTTTNDEYRYFLLCDGYDNLYRLFIRTTSSYSHYLAGKRLEREDEEIGYETTKDEIKVFKRNGDGFYIESGATALDFAFYIHTELGYHFESAYINNKKENPGYVLKDGDRIIINENSDIEPKLTWFRNVRTRRAINKLIEYFADKT